MAAQRILSKCYYRDCLSLAGKYKLAFSCVSAANGWKMSQTIGQVAELADATDSIGSPQRQLWGNKSLKLGES
ncbi:MAG: hypothetical protein A3J74_10225 [Elusimicrobia bacterium RIFCSPHIGHO2_02_FULL_57_9]|nr:MAG: hypothetical protein A3J74_10225 [Elusimicrobia bacterium RIFCSPHIGHO2_02_FULL_57_9]